MGYSFKVFSSISFIAGATVVIKSGGISGGASGGISGEGTSNRTSGVGTSNRTSGVGISNRTSGVGTSNDVNSVSSEGVIFVSSWIVFLFGAIPIFLRDSSFYIYLYPSAPGR